MQADSKFGPELDAAMRQGVMQRLPLTFQPFVNQQLAQWEFLFPNEQRSVERLLLYVAGLSAEESTALFRDLVAIEDKIGVRKWEFSTKEQTIQNSSQLAASPYYQEWRRAVQAVFDAADAHAAKAASATQAGNRLVLLEIPKPLELDAGPAWRRWRGIGKTIKLDLSPAGGSRRPLDYLLNGSAAAGSAGLLATVRARRSAAADTWIVDADRGLVDSILAAQPAQTGTMLLSYKRLDTYRQSFSREMNTMRKDLADADAVFDRLRKVDVGPWCPAEVAASPAAREFVRALYLSGNGAVIFGNSFVEWAASEAFRRARPTFLAATFGTRSKPKPFTGVAVFDNPDLINPLPPMEDLPGSALDAQTLALYVWLAAARYDEYQRGTLGVCIAESLAEAYIVAPPGFGFKQVPEPVPLNLFRDALREWIA